MYPSLIPRRIKLQPDGGTIYFDNQSGSEHLNINDTAAAILCLCDGSRTIPEIVTTLASKYDEDPATVAELVEEFMDESVTSGTIIQSEIPTPSPITITGSFDYWTPETLILELTHRCPLSCRHCYLSAGTGSDLSRELLHRLSPEVVTLGIDRVHLTGGEPFLYADLQEFVDFLAERKVTLTLTTSGFLSSPEIFHLSETIGKTGGWIQVSLDGLETNHNRFRGHPESFTQSICFIKNLTTRGIPVQVATCLTEDTIHEAEPLCRLVRDLGVNLWRVGTIIPLGRAETSQIQVTVAFQQKVDELRNQLRFKYGRQSFQIEGLEDERDPENFSNCGAGYRTLKIATDGSIHPCPMLHDPMGYLKFPEVTLFDFIRTNPATHYVELQVPSKELCGGCDNLNLCRGCPAAGLAYGQKQDSCSWMKHSSLITSPCD